MDDFNALPPIALGLFILWLGISGVCLVLIAVNLRFLARILMAWYEDWYEVNTEEVIAAEPPPPPPPPPKPTAADRMAHVRSFKRR